MSVVKNTTETVNVGRLTVTSPTGRSAAMLCFCVRDGAVSVARAR